MVNGNKWLLNHLKDNNIVDEIDAEIIGCLIDDSRQSTQKIANKIGAKRPTVHERIRKLVDRGFIQGYTTKLNYKKCGLPLKVFILVAFDSTTAEDLTQKDIGKQLSRLKYVISVDIITGSHDFLVEVAIDYMDKLADVIIEEIRNLKGVGNTQTLLSFKNYRYGFERV